MKKNESSKYLSSMLIDGCVAHTLFGRCSADERKWYSELTGKEWAVERTYVLIENGCKNRSKCSGSAKAKQSEHMF